MIMHIFVHCYVGLPAGYLGMTLENKSMFLGREDHEKHTFQFQLAWKAKLTIVNGMYKATV